MTLLDEARAATARARADGSLVPLPSTCRALRAGEVIFQVRRITGFVEKPVGTREEDPFRPPYTEALFVRDWPPAHALLLNKFPVLDDHLLLVTRAWADQEEPPDAADLRALAEAMEALDGLAFYNGGRRAGASQPHRHLQLVAREALGELPLEPLLRDALARGLDRAPELRFRHALLPGLPSADELRRRLGALGRDPASPGPHTLLAARGWALVVPRSAAKVGGLPVNSLAYAGYLAAKDAAGEAWLDRFGPWAVLEQAGEPWGPSGEVTRG